MKEQGFRKKIQAIQKFYADLINFSMVNGLLIVTWFFLDHQNVFWPKYVLLVWGILLVAKAYGTGAFSYCTETFCSLSSQWEERKIQEISGKKNSQRKIPLHRYGHKR